MSELPNDDLISNLERLRLALDGENYARVMAAAMNTNQVSETTPLPSQDYIEEIQTNHDGSITRNIIDRRSRYLGRFNPDIMPPRDLGPYGEYTIALDSFRTTDGHGRWETPEIRQYRFPDSIPPFLDLEAIRRQSEIDSNDWQWRISTPNNYPHISEQINEEEIMEELELEEPIVKPKRTRKPKELPLFSIEQTEGEKTSFHTGVIYGVNDGAETNSDWLSMCPYTEYIPADYLLISRYRWDENAYYGYPEVGLKKANLPINSFEGKKGLMSVMYKNVMGYGSPDKAAIVHYCKELINGYVQEDRNIAIPKLYTNGTRHKFEGIKDIFATGVPARYEMRTYRGHVGILSIYTNCYGDVFKPECLLVVHPDNYLHQKYQILMNGEIDITKCFLLVNKDLDSTSHPNKNFRAFFNKFLVPIISEYKLDVFKVPIDYIVDKCFTGKFELQSRNIFERKAEIEQLAKTFLENGFQ